MLEENDTIVAEATPHGQGGLSVIRLSGEKAYEVASRIFNRPLPKPGRHRFGKIYLYPDESRIIDEVVISAFEAPHSYTAENVIEISTHGNPVIIADTLESLYNAGARAAAPGEFTLRAYLNGRLDLTQAEAVADIITASSREASQRAVQQLQGGITKVTEAISENILSLLANCELELDFVEEEIELLSFHEKNSLLVQILQSLEDLLKGYEHSRCMREGVKVAITGRPNVGKSSLFNLIAGSDKAIVHSSPGTTRDIIETAVQINGVEFTVYDTAGIRDAEGEIEEEGVKRARVKVNDADVIIQVSSVDIQESDDYTANNASKIIKVMNKNDIRHLALPPDTIPVSALQGTGIDQIQQQMYNAVVGHNHSSECSISRERHFISVRNAKDAVKNALRVLSENYPAEILAEELREALSAMDDLTGKNRLSSVLNEIFSHFCIGK